MNILVTGATGFLGQHLCRKLIDDGHRVTILCRPTSRTANLDDLPLTKIYGDICDFSAVNQAVSGNEIVIHAAADISYWSQKKKHQNRTNIQGTRNLVEACLKNDVQRLVHVSSVVAIGMPENAHLPADENFSFNLKNLPLNYHNSKKHAEDIVLSAVTKGLDAVIVNPGFIWGQDGKKYRGSEFVHKILKSSAATYFTGGICVVHVADVIEGLIKALKKGKTGERYILGGENVTFKEITETIVRRKSLKRFLFPVPPAITWFTALILESTARITNRRPYITFAAHFGAGRFYYYTSNKAISALGYSFRDFETILNECFLFMEEDLPTKKTHK